MNFSEFESLPDDPQQLPPSRRRRAQRLLMPLDADERAVLIDRMAQRSTSSVEFFLFSLIAGMVIGLGFLLDQPGILFLGLLVAPLMSPAIGLALGTMIGSPGFFGRSLVSLLVGGFFAMIGGLFWGLVSGFWFPGVTTFFIQLRIHARLSLVYGLIVAVGAVLTAAFLVRLPERSRLPSLALTYGLYLPLVVAGFGLTSGVEHLFPDGLVIFILHLALATFLGALTLGLLGYRPPTLFGYTLGGALTLLAILLLVAVSGAGIAVGGQLAIPTFTQTPTATASSTATLTLTPIPPTSTPVPPTVTLTPTPVPPTLTFTPSPVPPSPTPTPIYALVSAALDTGVRIRAEPGGITIKLLSNGTLVQIVSGVELFNGYEWVKVRTFEGVEGWIVLTLLTIATPAPNWSP